MPIPILKGPERRLDQVRHVFQFLPPMTLRDVYGVTAHCCGRCFKKLGDDPFNGRPGKLTPGVPKGARCVFCGHPANPVD